MVLLCEVHRGESEERQVECIEPDNRGIALVSMIMPVPCRRNDNIAASQGHLFSFNSREALAVDDESEGERDVPVRRSSLARVDDLKSTIDGVCCVRGFCNTL